MIIPENIKYVLEKLNNHNYEAYIVGGCVRDILLGYEPYDYDITTNALPEEIKEVFSDCGIINKNGEKHGTVTIRYNHENIEITTFRCDGQYLDHRHPNDVIFTRNLKEDLSRRDFTINAMAYDLNNKLYDYFDGEKDLNNNIIKAVGNPHKRFDEDALRILRALRFSSVLGFDIDNETLDAMYILKDTVSYVSKERIKIELDKMICGKYFSKIMRNKKIREIFGVIIPEIKDTFDFDQKSKYHSNDLYNHILNVVEKVDNNHILRLSALFHDIGKATNYQVDYRDGKEIYHFLNHEKKSYEIALNVLKRLKYSNDEIEKISFLVLYHDYKFTNKIRSVRKFMAIMPKKDMDLLLDYLIMLKIADASDHNNVELFDFSIVRELYYKIKNDPDECYNLKTLKIDGNQLKKLGYDGKDIGIILNDVLDEVINNRLKNNNDSIIDYIKKNY